MHTPPTIKALVTALSGTGIFFNFYTLYLSKPPIVLKKTTYSFGALTRCSVRTSTLAGARVHSCALPVMSLPILLHKENSNRGVLILNKCYNIHVKMTTYVPELYILFY